ncbi:MAG: polysaccharide deacetylase family protein [Clostridia bacterium]|nr:polysaccharide deacetylase family protein [Clostridia bacterium]
MEKARISISIDDGKKNFLSVADKLIKLNIPATLNIVPGAIDKSKKVEVETFSKEELVDLYKTGIFEIANHSNLHTNLEEDIIEGRRKLVEWLNLDKNAPLGFASPGSEIKIKKALESEKRLREMGVLYLRTHDEGGKEEYKRLDELYNKTKNPEYYVKKESNAFYSKGDFAISSLVAYKGVNDLEEILLLTDHAVKEKKGLTIMFHNFAKPNEELYSNVWTFGSDRFYKFIEYIDNYRQQGKLDILTSKDGLER